MTPQTIIAILLVAGLVFLLALLAFIFFFVIPAYAKMAGAPDYNERNANPIKGGEQNDN